MKKLILIVPMLQILAFAKTEGTVEVYNQNDYGIKTNKLEPKIGIKADVKASILEVGADAQTKSINILESLKENSSLYLKLNYLDNYVKTSYKTKGEFEVEANVGYKKYITYNFQAKVPHNLKNVQLIHKLNSTYEPIKTVELGANIVVNQAIKSEKLEYKDLLSTEDKTIENGILAQSYDLYGKYKGIDNLELEAGLLYQNIIEKNKDNLYKTLWEQSAEFSLGMKKQTELQEKLAEKQKELTEKIKELENKEQKLEDEYNELAKEIRTATEDKKKEILLKIDEKEKESEKTAEELVKVKEKKLKIQEFMTMQYYFMNDYKKKSQQNFKEYLAKMRENKKGYKKYFVHHYFGTRLGLKYTGIKNAEFGLNSILGGTYSKSKLEKYIKLEANAKYEYKLKDRISIIPEFVGTVKFTDTMNAILEPKLNVKAELAKELILDGKISVPVDFDVKGYSNSKLKTDISLKYSW